MVIYSKYNVYRQSIHMKYSLLCPLTLRVTLKQPLLYLKQWKNSLMLNTLSSSKSVARHSSHLPGGKTGVKSSPYWAYTEASIIYTTLPNSTLKISFSSMPHYNFFFCLLRHRSNLWTNCGFSTDQKVTKEFLCQFTGGLGSSVTKTSINWINKVTPAVKPKQ